MEGDFIKINKWLMPLSWLYGLGVKMRNMLFNIGILKSRAFNTPVISVGNITVGGTGKTPHVEYLINILRNHYKVAVLSRGYKRKSKGFVLADSSSTVADIGDEPYQMKQKFPQVTVAVDKDRCHGIEQIEQGDNNIDVILLDDAFQHRYVKPGINILLVDYHRLIIYDKLLPAGRLREPLEGKDRADIVIVTKCPSDLKPMAYRVITKALNLFPYQRLFFTTIAYGQLQPALHQGTARDLHELKDDNVLLLSGIASPRQLYHDLSSHCSNIQTLTFPDHHRFTPKDVHLINETFAAMEASKCIITTEKDLTRLRDVEGLNDEVTAHLYVLPITIQFMHEQEDMFNHYIIDYVRKNSRNGILAKGKDDHQSQNSNRPGNRTRTISFRNN
ncbi:tetraacyldisaccharide 4'-kinase [Prevotella sp. tc2-28]|uniref:tetraacyldisaccharide 4'-kinase n=1 Tax=Prevotella sp. tc2-28 TaxID=1761888 RepID=UPI000B88C70A